jgi:hypothetical protein
MCSTQNSLLLTNLMSYYKKNDKIDQMLRIINGETKISLRIVDWFTTNYAKKHYTVYTIPSAEGSDIPAKRFKVYVDYKLRLRSYSKLKFDPFCRWERITIPYKEDKCIQTTIGQLNFFKWAFENEVISYIENNYADIEKDMNSRNSTSKRKLVSGSGTNITRKKREELSISAAKVIKKEEVEIVITFN